MTTHAIFPNLDGFEPTRQSLHLYAKAASAIPRAYAQPHPKWWHLSMKVVANGLVTGSVPLPSGGDIWLAIDLVRHQITLHRHAETITSWDLRERPTASVLGNEIISAVENLGLTGGDYDRDKFVSDEPRIYDPGEAEKFLVALSHADRIFKQFRDTLDGEPSPVQLWPHGFDLAFEWFGTRLETYEEHGEMVQYPSQINLGFYPAAPAYFYSNPWPFEAAVLVDQSLPAGAHWHTEGWQGTILPYAEIQGDADGEGRLLAYAQQVHAIAAPTLSADWAAANRR